MFDRNEREGKSISVRTVSEKHLLLISFILDIHSLCCRNLCMSPLHFKVELCLSFISVPFYCTGQKLELVPAL